MRLIAQATLGALALASVVTASASAQAYTVQVNPPAVVVEPRDACLRAPAFRPAYCFHRDWRHDRFAFNDRDREMRDHMWRERERERERQAYLDRRWEMTH